MKGKKLISVLLSMAMILSLLSFSVFAENASGEGTAESPYLITEGQQLAALLTNDSTKVFHIISDIELPSTYVPVTGFSGQLIGYNANGTDKEMRTIKVTISGSGLFATATGAFQIKNITLNGSVTDSDIYTGGFIGYISDSTAGAEISNCINNATISNTANVEHIGGIVGRANSEVVITNCHNKKSVTGKNHSVGGIVGYTNSAKVVISKCSNTAEVKTTNSAGVQVGGIIGYSNSPVSECFNTGNVSGSSNVGGIVGRQQNAQKIINCFNIADITATKADGKAGGIVGYTYNKCEISCCYNTGDAKSQILAANNANNIPTLSQNYYLAETTDLTTGALSPTDIKAPNKYVGFEPTIWDIIEGSNYPRMNLINNPYIIERDGSAELPFVIDSKEDFLLIGTEGYGTDKNYILTADITLDSTYVPIENFTGSIIGYDAAGTKEEMRTIDVKLTGYSSADKRYGRALILTASGAFKLKNLTLTGTVNNAYPAAGGTAHPVAGFVANVGETTQGAIIENCVNKAAITNSYQKTGGIIGTAETTGKLVITKCVNEGTITGKSYYVGGIVGYENYGISSIEDSANKGNIVAEQYGYQGGISGRSTANISRCYNSGNISGVTNTGGIAGYFQNSKTVLDCFNVGEITASQNDAKAAGIVGASNADITITNCYNIGKVTAFASDNFYSGVKNVTKTGCYFLADVTDSATGALSKTDMKNKNKYNGYESSVWDIIESSDYPYMNLISNTYIVKTDGSEKYPYLIKNYDDLKAISTKGLDKTYLITNDITIPADYTSIKGFSGTLMCDKSDIKTITFNNSSNGLFATITGKGTVKNLNLAGNIKYTATKTGAVVGSCTSATAVLENITSDVTITKDDSLDAYLNFIGGLAGEFKGSITDCVNTGEIYGLNYVGGIVGDHTGGTISKCSNTAQLFADTGRIGGIAGRSYSASDRVVEKCYNTGYLDDGYMAGGIVGECIGAGKLTIDSCYNNGDASYDSFCGILGKFTNTYNGSAEIKSCYTTGVIGDDGYKYQKPIAAESENVTITSCYYLGSMDDNVDNTTPLAKSELASASASLGSAFADSANEYEFPQITGNINTNAIIYYLVTINNEGQGGNTSATAVYVPANGKAKIKYTLTEGYEISDLKLNDISIATPDNSGTYETAEIHSDCVYTFVFSKIPVPEVVSLLVYDHFIIKNEFAGILDGYSDISENYAAVIFAKIANGNGNEYGIAISSDYTEETASEASWTLTDSVLGAKEKCFGAYIHSENKGETYYARVYQKDSENNVTYFDNVVSFTLRTTLD